MTVLLLKSSSLFEVLCTDGKPLAKYHYILSYIYNFVYAIFRLNHLKTLPKGFGACPMLEVLDLTYNNLNEASLSANFFYLGKLFMYLEYRISL